jgi:hypothetical protein
VGLCPAKELLHGKRNNQPMEKTNDRLGDYIGR